MTDVLKPSQRSRCMSRIKGRNTSIELRLRKALWAVGLRYRLHLKLPGKPDIVFRKAKIAIFVDGCFWHCCPIHGVRPKTNVGFWHKKLSENVERDNRNNDRLSDLGWQVLRFWEHEVEKDINGVVEKIELAIALCVR